MSNNTPGSWGYKVDEDGDNFELSNDELVIIGGCR